MSRTIQFPRPAPAPAKPGATSTRDASELLASVAGEEDPGAAVDAPVPPPRPSARGAPDVQALPRRTPKKRP